MRSVSLSRGLFVILCLLVSGLRVECDLLVAARRVVQWCIGVIGWQQLQVLAQIRDRLSGAQEL